MDTAVFMGLVLIVPTRPPTSAPTHSHTPQPQCRAQAGPWGPCSATCGSGFQTRSVTCTDTSGRPCNSAVCPYTPTQQGCTNPFAGPCVNFYYTIGEYSQCTASCGGGIQTRSQNCVTATGQPAQPFNCAGLQPQADPQAQISCNTIACPTTYGWQPTPWSGCSQTCGQGELYPPLKPAMSAVSPHRNVGNCHRSPCVDSE